MHVIQYKVRDKKQRCRLFIVIKLRRLRENNLNITVNGLGYTAVQASPEEHRSRYFSVAVERNVRRCSQFSCCCFSRVTLAVNSLHCQHLPTNMWTPLTTKTNWRRLAKTFYIALQKIFNLYRLLQKNGLHQLLPLSVLYLKLTYWHWRSTIRLCPVLTSGLPGMALRCHRPYWRLLMKWSCVQISRQMEWSVSGYM